MLAARALFEGPSERVWVRVARLGQRVYLDLADQERTVVEIDAAGWRVTQAPPVHFFRPPNLRTLPAPERGGHIDDLRLLLNIGSGDNWTLAKGWLLAALRGAGPYFLLAITGEQGSAKSMTSRLLRAVIDPCMPALRSLPRSEDDLVIAATRTHVLAFDNVSDLPPWLSDALCRLATGGGLAKRRLHTDAEECLLESTNPIILNGIDGLTGRADLAERTVTLDLPAIPPAHRRTEVEVLREFARVHPRVLGALLDAVCLALAQEESVQLPSLPRMADAARWVTAAEPALGMAPGAFLRALSIATASALAQALEADPITPCVEALLRATPAWTGTPSDLLEELARHAADALRRPTWPRNAAALGTRLRRLAPSLRDLGLNVEWSKGRRREIRITHLGQRPEAASAALTL